MSSFAFGGSSARREDVSMRLRVQRMKNTADQTKALEEESRKMEERLQELKLAMGREKEEREKQGGGFWKTGQQGTLTKHAQALLSRPADPKPKDLKPRRIKIMKEEPEAVALMTASKVPAVPGTMAFLLQKEKGRGQTNFQATAGDSASAKGTAHCGQCEQKVAVVSCFECSEHYCSHCFASFHLKGALKKHRSAPVASQHPSDGCSASSLEESSHIVSSFEKPRSEALSDVVSASDDSPSGKVIMVRWADSIPVVHSPQPPRPNSVERTSDLLRGTFDEEDSAQSFQDALHEWRGSESSSVNAPAAMPANTNKKSLGKSSLADRNEKQTQMKLNRPMQNDGNGFELRHSNAVALPLCMDEGTNTNIVKRVSYQPDFQLNSSVTYADRLLLKRHRRTEVLALSPNSEMHSLTTEKNRTYDESEEDPAQIGEHKMDFGQLQELLSPSQYRESSTPKMLSFIDVQDLDGELLDDSDAEQATQYQVFEEDDCIEVDASSYLDIQPLPALAESALDSRQHRQSLKDGTTIPPSSYLNSNIIVPNITPSLTNNSAAFEKSYPPAAARTSSRRSVASMHSKSAAMRNTPPVQNGATHAHDVKTARQPLNLGTSAEHTSGSFTVSRPPATYEAVKSIADVHTVGLSSAVSDGRELHVHAVTQCPLPESAHGFSPSSALKNSHPSRSDSAAAIRSHSRARSRAERAASLGKGQLTVDASESLKDVSRRLSAKRAFSHNIGSHVDTLGEFFCVGLPTAERSLTPSGSRLTAVDVVTELQRYRLSNKLYKTSPHVWRPESSMASTVSDNYVERYYSSIDADISQSTPKRTLQEVYADSNMLAFTHAADALVNERVTSSTEILAQVMTGIQRTAAAQTRPNKENGVSQTLQSYSTLDSTFSPTQHENTRLDGKASANVHQNSHVSAVTSEDVTWYDSCSEESRAQTRMDDDQTLDELERELAGQTDLDESNNDEHKRLVTPYRVEPGHTSDNEEADDEDLETTASWQLRESLLMNDFEEMEQAFSEEEVKELS